MKIARNPHGRRDHRPAIVLLGAQWGDEGKGKATDILGDRVKYVVRYQSGNRAWYGLLFQKKVSCWSFQLAVSFKVYLTAFKCSTSSTKLKTVFTLDLLSKYSVTF